MPSLYGFPAGFRRPERKKERKERKKRVRQLPLPIKEKEKRKQKESGNVPLPIKEKKKEKKIERGNKEKQEQTAGQRTRGRERTENKTTADSRKAARRQNGKNKRMNKRQITADDRTDRADDSYVATEDRGNNERKNKRALLAEYTHRLSTSASVACRRLVVRESEAEPGGSCFVVGGSIAADNGESGSHHKAEQRTAADSGDRRNILGIARGRWRWAETADGGSGPLLTTRKSGNTRCQPYKIFINIFKNILTNNPRGCIL